MDELEKVLLSARHGQRVYRIGKEVHREGNPERIAVHAHCLEELSKTGVVPKLISAEEGKSVEQDLGGNSARGGGFSWQQLMEALELVHREKPLQRPFSAYIFKRYEAFIKERSWLEEHFPLCEKGVLLHGALNLSNAVISGGALYLIDFCDSYIGPKECDLGSLYFAEFFPFVQLQQMAKLYSYDLKKTLFFAVLYAYKQLGKPLNQEKRALVEERLRILKEQYREIG